MQFMGIHNLHCFFVTFCPSVLSGFDLAHAVCEVKALSEDEIG